MNEFHLEIRKEMDDLLNVVEPMMTASLMSDVVVLQVKCNHSTHVINCCLPYATHRAVCKINR